MTHFNHATGILAVVAVTATTSLTPAIAQDSTVQKRLSAFGNVVKKSTGQVKKTAANAQAVLVKKEDGVPLVGDLTDADEQALGRELAGRMCAVHPSVNNDSLQRYINSVGVYIAGQTDRPNLAWTFGIIASDDINAFALPGGYILVTSGLYAMLRNEAELAGVLGHEIAHVTLRHHVRLLQKERLIARGTDFLAGKTRQDAIKMLAGSGAGIYLRSLDRNAEFECDRLGMEFTARAGYDPYAYIEVIDRMGADTRTDRLSLLFKTHPHPADRIAALEEAINASWKAVGGKVPGRWVALH